LKESRQEQTLVIFRRVSDEEKKHYILTTEDHSRRDENVYRRDEDVPRGGKGQVQAGKGDGVEQIIRERLPARRGSPQARPRRHRLEAVESLVVDVGVGSSSSSSARQNRFRRQLDPVQQVPGSVLDEGSAETPHLQLHPRSGVGCY